jgi:hypothetical protein
VREIAVTSATLPSVLSKGGVKAEDYDALVPDTQGSELLVLRGPKAFYPCLATSKWKRLILNYTRAERQ